MELASVEKKSGFSHQRLLRSENLFLLATLVSPLWFLSRAGINFTLYDALIVLTLMLVLLERRRLCLPDRSLLIPAYFFVLFALLSAFRAVRAMESITQIAQYLFIFLVQLPLLLAIVRDIRECKRQIIAWGLSTLVLTFIAAVEVERVGPAVGSPRYTWLFRKGGQLSMMVVFGLPAVMALPELGANRAWKWLLRLVVLAGLGVALYVAALTLTRAGLVAYPVTLITYWSLPRKGRFHLLPSVAKFLILTAVLVPLALVLYQTSASPWLKWRVEKGVQLEGSAGGRILTTRGAFLSIPDNVVTGVGLDNGEAGAMLKYTGGLERSKPHNIILSFLFEVGVVGALAFVGILIYYIRSLLYVLRRVKFDTLEGMLLRVLVASYAGMFAYFAFHPMQLHRSLWLVLGLAPTFAQVLRERDGNSTSQRRWSKARIGTAAS